MSFLAPGYLVAAGIAALVVTALHFLATRRAAAAPLPTIRFVPGAPADAMERALRPTELLLLALRVLMLAALGLALAAPIAERSRGGTLRIVVADVSAGAGGLAGVRDSVAAWERPGDVVLVFDSAARARDADASDSAAAPGGAGARHGALSSAFLGALREATARRATADSFDLVIVSPLRAGAVDAATTALRARWPGRVRLVQVRGTPAGSPVAGAAPAWAGATRPTRATRRASPDTVGALVADGDVVVAAFARSWEYSADSLRGARVIARWVDGTAAAIEWPRGGGCERSTTIAPDSVGDLILRPEFARLAGHLAATCGGAAAGADDPIAAPVLASLAGPAHAAAASAFPRPVHARSPWTPWLIALTMVLALAELLVRRGRAR